MFKPLKLHTTMIINKKLQKHEKGNWLFAEIAAEAEMAAGCSGMQRCPHLGVSSVDVCTSIHQHADNVQGIINTALSPAHFRISINQSSNQSINQSERLKQSYIALCHKWIRGTKAETRSSVHIHCKQCQKVRFFLIMPKSAK